VVAEQPVVSPVATTVTKTLAPVTGTHTPVTITVAKTLVSAAG
jgi:hypothetical protein